MKTRSLFAASLSLAALGAASLVSTPVHAQDSTKPMVQSSPTTGKPVVVVPMNASMTDMYKTSWVFHNLDEREVKRYKAQGFNDSTIKGAANIALRTGLSLDYVLRMIREAGIPLATLAAQNNISADAVNADIPGYGLETMSIMTAPSSMTTPMMRSSMDMTTTSSVSSASMPPTATSTTTLPPASGTDTAPGASTATPAAAAQGTIVDVVMGNPDFSTLLSALRSANLLDTLRGTGPFTVFAPTNAAFAKLPTGTLDDLMKPENQSKLQSILNYHVVPGRLMASDIMAMSNPSTPKSASGATLNVKTTAPIMINNANVTATDIVTSNGVIHVIDTVLTPPTDAPAQP